MKIYKDKGKWFKFWRKLVANNSLDQEVQFLYQILDKFAPNARSIIDLGGGTGLHAQKLAEYDYVLTVFDASKQLLDAVPTFSTLNTILGTFEDIAKVLGSKQYDVAISMWTTFTYILDETKRSNFFAWLSANIKDLIVLDQSNFYLYPKKYRSEPIVQEVDDVKMKVWREFELSDQFLRTGRYHIEVKDSDGSVDKFIDPEVMQFVPIENLQQLLGENWELVETYGSYDGALYDKEFSKRLITVFKRKDV